MSIRENKGITLIILIITIVVMLILTTTVIVSVSGYDDIRNLNNLANDLDALQSKVNIYYEKNKSLPVSTKINDDVQTYLGENKNSNDGVDYYKIDLSILNDISLTFGSEKSEKDYYIINEQSHSIYYYAGIEATGTMYYGIKDLPQNLDNAQFGVENYELKTRTNAIVTDGVIDIQLEVYSDIQNDNISAYKFKIDNEEWTPLQNQNSYIFHNLEQYKTYKVSMMIINNNSDETYASNNELDVTIRELPISLTIDGKLQGAYNNPLIPAGFVAINENDAFWQSSDGYKNGLVITDKVNEIGISEGNEFVWVPVDGTNVTFEKKTWYKSDDTTVLGVTAEECSESLPEALVNSVTTNGGFYIARYEAGIATNMPQTNLTTDSTAIYGNGTYKPVSKKDAIVWNNLQWGANNNVENSGNGAVTVAKNMYPESDTYYGVISSLVYGTQWDTTLKFITTYNVGETGYNTYAVNPTGMGNYSSGDSLTSTTAPANSSALEIFRQKNIYDMAGNLWEWTMETNSSNCIMRGGFYNADALENPSSYRGTNPSDGYTPSIGFRVALYLK